MTVFPVIAVPVIGVAEYGNLVLGENNIGPADQLPIILPIAHAAGPQSLSEPELNACVQALYGLHVFSALLRG